MHIRRHNCREIGCRIVSRTNSTRSVVLSSEEVLPASGSRVSFIKVETWVSLLLPSYTTYLSLNKLLGVHGVRIYGDDGNYLTVRLKEKLFNRLTVW